MCSYDSLICVCSVIGNWVRIDQTRAECSQEHGCGSDQLCPLSDAFLYGAAAVPAQATPMAVGMVRLSEMEAAMF